MIEYYIKFKNVLHCITLNCTDWRIFNLDDNSKEIVFYYLDNTICFINLYDVDFIYYFDDYSERICIYE